MNAIETLQDDHRHLRQLLNQLVNIPVHNPQGRAGLVDRLDHDLSLHLRLKMDVFYPALRAALVGRNDVPRQEALEEHRLIEGQALLDLKAADPGSDAFEARARVLKSLFDQHAQGEEELLFPLAIDSMSAAQLNELGHQLAVRRAEIFSRNMAQENEPSFGEGLPSPQDAIRLAGRTAKAFVRDPAKLIGRGVEEIVRLGCHLTAEVREGARRGRDKAGEGREGRAR